MGGGWVLSGFRRQRGPLLGTLVAVTTAGLLTVAAASVVGASTSAPAGRLSGASVVVAGNTQLTRVQGDETEQFALPAYRGVPAPVAHRIAAVPGVKSATGEGNAWNGPGRVDLVAVTAKPDTSASELADRIKRVIGPGYTVATGTARGDLANLNVAAERANGQALAGSIVPFIVLTALFAVASTVALSVSSRRRHFALLRAVGATPGQVRRGVLAELGLLGVIGGIVAFPLGAGLGTLAVRALASHQLLPADSSAWVNPLELLISCGTGVLVCGLSGWIAARRAGRVHPVQAVRDADRDPRWPDPVRTLLGIAALGGAITLLTLTLHQSGPDAELALAFPVLLAFMAAAGLLGPVLIRLSAALLRPLSGMTGAVGRLALADVKAQPRRIASAVVPVVMAVSMIGAVFFANRTLAAGTVTQNEQRLVATSVVSGAHVTASALRTVRHQPGVRAAVGITPVSVVVSDPDLDLISGEAVSSGPLGQVLDLGVVSGGLANFGPGDVAISTLEGGAMSAHIGELVTVYLADGTPYRARVTALYTRPLGFGDILLPDAVAATHNGTPPGYGQILVRGGSIGELPGLHVASRSVVNAQMQLDSEQSDFADNMILGIIAILAAVCLVNTLVMATARRRGELRLLRRIGATRGQIAAVFGWQTVFVTVVGVLLGAGAATGTLIGVSRALTGSGTPSVPVFPAVMIIAAVAALSAAATLIPFRVISR